MTNGLSDHNPNPVLRLDADGRLAYTNPAGNALADALGTSEGVVRTELFSELRTAALESPPRLVEVKVGNRSFALLPVPDPAAPGNLNLYATDVTAARAVERFPDSNPNPVLRLSREGILIYANPASAPLVAGLACAIGRPLPGDLAERIFAACDRGNTIEVEASGRTYELKPVLVREFNFVNVYGTDVTAQEALTKFPDQNPNPVLRFTPDGRLLYANPSAAPIVRGLGLSIGSPLPAPLWDRVENELDGPMPQPIEVIAEDRTYELLVVDIPEFSFINAYGTDVTAARLIEQVNHENERLLLNILPASIAARLRGGETVIADQFDELSVLFADLVDFTSLASAIPAGEVVRVLTDIFSACDELADRYGLEKIKTIGDAYMVVGGITPGEVEAPRRVAEMALDLLAAIGAYRAPDGRRLRVRVGLHVGPAVAGVIGVRKFFYDVWGDTVNTASRLEATALPDTIQVLEPTMRRLGDAFTFAPRGSVELKGKGTLETWLLTGRSAVVAETRAREAQS